MGDTAAKKPRLSGLFQNFTYQAAATTPQKVSVCNMYHDGGLHPPNTIAGTRNLGQHVAPFSTPRDSTIPPPHTHTSGCSRPKKMALRTPTSSSERHQNPPS